MSDQSLTGVTTRSLDTSQDINRAEAISTRSGLARLYADQFRASRSNLRRGAVVRETTGPAVPAASGDVTQTQDVSVPGSFQDVLDAAGDFQGDSQSANQTVNPGMGGGFGPGSSVGGGGGSGAQSSGSTSSGAVDASCPSGWRDANGNCTDPPQGVDCVTLPDGRKIGDCEADPFANTPFPPGGTSHQSDPSSGLRIISHPAPSGNGSFFYIQRADTGAIHGNSGYSSQGVIPAQTLAIYNSKKNTYEQTGSYGQGWMQPQNSNWS